MRREWLRRATGTIAVAAWFFLTTGVVGSLPANAQTAAFTIHQIADGDYAHFGEVAMTTPDNAGDIANIGIVVGRDAVAIIDTGGSVAVGQSITRGGADDHRQAGALRHQHP